MKIALQVRMEQLEWEAKHMGNNRLEGLGNNWFGNNWFGNNWAGASGSPAFSMQADKPLAEVQVPSDFAAKFRERDWDPDLLALMILPEFLGVKIAGKTWDQSIVLPAPNAPTQTVIDELLLTAITERPEALSEIVQQHQNGSLGRPPDSSSPTRF